MKLQLNYPFYLDEYMSNVEADLEFSKAMDVVSCNVSISQFLCFMHQLKKLSTE